ncbi:MAG: hypothetical protein AB7L17_09845 [Ilumatobacteraceae bacterium]
MPVLVAIVLIAMVATAVVILRMRQRPHTDSGLHSFRRHIDALSPEARREVIDRARKRDDEDTD